MAIRDLLWKPDLADPQGNQRYFAPTPVPALWTGGRRTQ